jgi:hypothetical protein
MSSRHLKTAYGTFRVTINDDTRINVQTREQTKIGTRLSVGGNNTYVFISVSDTSDTAHLLNLKTKDGGCDAYNKLITGKNTVGMVNLAFTVLKQIAPHIKRVKLEDESDFTCTLPNGSTAGISMTVYDLLFYEQAYYERRFNAYLINPDIRKLYEKYKQGFQQKLPNDFSFHNKDLNEMLIPIYLESTTWRDFLDKIHTIPNTCEVLYPWYKYAIREIFNNFPVERQNWMIELYDNPKIETVQYTVEKLLKGGRRKTRKSNDSIYKYTFAHLVDSIERPFYDIVYDLKYK